MIMTVETLRTFVNTDEPDQGLALRLQALERTIKGYTNNTFTRILEENGGIWPADIQMGVIELIKWDLGMREKQGIASETISRHSVSYVDTNAGLNACGYPKSMLGFLKPYMRARF